jgi:hypothetical protein
MPAPAAKATTWRGAPSLSGSTKRPAGGIASSVPPTCQRVVGPVGEAPIRDALDGDAHAGLVGRTADRIGAPLLLAVDAGAQRQMLARLEANASRSSSGICKVIEIASGVSRLTSAIRSGW